MKFLEKRTEPARFRGEWFITACAQLLDTIVAFTLGGFGFYTSFHYEWCLYRLRKDAENETDQRETFQLGE